MLSRNLRKKLEMAHQIVGTLDEKQLVPSNKQRSGRMNLDESLADYVGQNQMVLPMVIEQLQEKLARKSQNLLYFLCLKSSGFKLLLDKSELDVRSIAIIINAITKACECGDLPFIRKLMLIIVSSKVFVTQHISTFLEYAKCYSLRKWATPMLGLAMLLCALEEVIPDPTCKRAKKIQAMLEKTLAYLRSNKKAIPPSFEDILKTLQAKRKKKRRRHEFWEPKDFDKPPVEVHPDEFRGIPIIPTVKELLKDDGIILRPHIASGPFDSSNDYLDIQFRLLREDFLRPLRKGIISCVKPPSHDSKDKFSKEEVFLYTDVHILPASFVHTKIVHTVRFDVAPYENFDWKKSKRLTPGSLLCLSCDSFKTFKLAVVYYTKEPENGSTDINFIDIEDQLMYYDPMLSYVMIESAALFEAYRHNLVVLQNISEEEFPFQSYIVDAEREVEPVAYVSPDVRYNLTSLKNLGEEENEEEVKSTDYINDVNKRAEKSSKEQIDRSGGENKEWKYGICGMRYSVVEKVAVHSRDLVKDERRDLEWQVVKARRKQEKREAWDVCTEIQVKEEDVLTLDPLGSVVLFDDASWPSGEELGYDEAQMQAIKGALRQEFCLIQGPPGTGKTFITLKIIKTILANRNRKEGNKFQPILIASYTNHALDQVLEGVLKFTERVVRIGGRSESKILQKYTLREYRLSSFYQKSYLQGCYTKMRAVTDQLKSAQELFIQTSNEIISYDALQNYISAKHRESLESSPKAQELGSDRSTLVALWLLDVGDDDIDDDWCDGKSKSCKGTSGTEKGTYFKVLVDYIKQLHCKQEQRLSEIKKQQCEKVSVYCDSDTFEPGDDDIEGLTHFSQNEIGDSSLNRPPHLKEDRKAIETTQEIPFTEVYNWLSQTEPMTDSEANEVNNVWRLPTSQKWQLYCNWWRKYTRKNYDTMLELCVEFETLSEECRKESTKRDYLAICQEDVIGMTTTGAAKYHDLVELLKPYVVIIEEAAQVLEAHVVTTIKNTAKHVILIGDHKQLKPRPTSLVDEYNLEVSLFERMINNGLQCYRLEKQFRMRPCISSLLVPAFYPSLEDAEKVIAYPAVKGVRRSMFFIDHEYPERQSEKKPTYYNEHEANFLVAFCKYLVQQGYEPEQITILTLYDGQLNAVIEKLKKIECCEGVIVANADGYQGRENDIVLISLVRSNKEGKIGFLDVANRMCVCLSRARIGMYCIGNFRLITMRSTLWENIIRKVERNEDEAIGDTLEIYCRKHPRQNRWISKAEEFEKYAPLGGCTKKCHFLYPCGHKCEEYCHPVDEEHEILKCKVMCTKKLDCVERHRCNQLCHYPNPCPPCSLKTDKIIPRCGHSISMDCGGDPNVESCTADCNKKLPCGHWCKQRCGVVCSEFPCTIPVGRTLPCGHGEVNVECSQSSNRALFTKCAVKCEEILDCGHPCQGSCGSCLQGRLHVRCEEHCERLLVCGHHCLKKCGEACPPCELICEVRCNHRRCSNLCGEICLPCKFSCDWKCQHRKCTQPCGDPCDCTPCSEQCANVLLCGHNCKGLCGEPCPQKCQECDDLKILSVFRKRECNRELKYELLDCEHQHAIGEITSYMHAKVARVEMKACPTCCEPIWNGKRFSKVIFECLKTTYRIKQRIRQQNQDAKSMQYALYLSLDMRTSSDHEVHRLVEKLRECLEPSWRHNIAEVMILENHIKYAQRLAYVENRMLLAKKELKTINQLVEFVLPYLGIVVDFIISCIDSASFMQLCDADREIRRMEILTMVLDWYLKNASKLKTDAEWEYNKAMMCLMNCQPFKEKNEEMCRKLIGKANMMQNGVPFELPHLEKSKISRALCSRVGDWWKCPEGHIYSSLVQYGEKDEDSRCSECVDFR